MRLSELKDTDVLMVDRKVISKEELINNLAVYSEFKVYSTEIYKPSVDIMVILRGALLEEAIMMYPGWYTEMKKLITEQDEKDLQTIVDRILSRSKSVTYFQDKELEIDM